ncbi:MAG: hypothetical protein HGB10_09800 [Coriobacteriia bacterium]|nr:hypothetical protein [Coriobacteriia bacterium]
MKRSPAAIVVTIALAIMVTAPVVAHAFQVTGGGGTQTANPYGLWYAGKEACAQEGCHRSIADKPSPHSSMVTDLRANPSALVPAADSGFWPLISSFAGSITLRPRDMYLQLGDHEGFLEYIGPSGSELSTKVVPADDLPVWSPLIYLIEEAAWEASTTKLGNSVYGQSCSSCHNVGPTRPANASYTLPNGVIQTTSTPTSVSEWGIQCEACHGSGKNPNGHKNGVPGVVGGYQILKAQVCGQCHVAGTTPQRNVSGAAFGNPNGYTTDTTLSAYLTPSTVVETEGAIMRLASGETTVKPKFLPNGANFSMRHSYYNEWLVNKAPSGYGGDKGHADPVNNAVKTTAAGGDTKCFKCHTGLGFLNRIDAKSPSGTRIVPTFPTASLIETADPGISCMVCHTGHVEFKEGGGYDSMRKWGNGKEVSCGDCHNWQFEMLEQRLQYETIGGKEYTRASANTRTRHPQREMVTGGAGGEDGLGGMWGVGPSGEYMPHVECNDCHMPRTHKEGMPSNDNGSPTGTRMSHRFHIVEPGDAARWKLRPNGESCVATCHSEAGADFTRADFQTWIDQKRAAIATVSAEATGALDALAQSYGLTDYLSFIATQPSGGAASALPAARWSMLQHAAQNVDFVVSDGSGGLHNPTYARAGLTMAKLWAASATATLDATLGAGPALGEGMTATGSLLGVEGVAIPGAEVALQVSTNGGSTWGTVATAKPDASGAFSIPTGTIVGSRIFRVRFAPSAGVEYLSASMDVHVPVTAASVLPASAATMWTDAASAQVTMTATPGSLTFYTLSGATTQAATLYLDLSPITISAQGKTDVAFWSTDGFGTEATQTLSVMLDRSAPQIISDVASVYSNKATVHVAATDTGSGVDAMRYSFRGADTDVDASAFTLTTYELGNNALTVTATDNAGFPVTRTINVWVKASPALTMSPSTTKTIRSGTRLKLSSVITRGADALGAPLPLTGRPITVQRWDGRKWVTAAKLNSGSGKPSWTRKFVARGTSYWRWAVTADSYSNAAYSRNLKVVVK